MKKNILSLAALLIASATAFTACSSSDDSIISENQQPAQTTGKYTMTIQASKGDGASTRALTLDGNTLNATWATTENVYVKKGSSWATGSLKPQADGATATLKGTLSNVTINAADVLTLQFPKSGDISYDGQVGTLEDIAANFDYATASVTVSSVDGSGNITVSDPVTFTNQQSIVKFTLKNGETLLNASKVTASLSNTLTGKAVTAYEYNIPASTYTTNGNGVVYLAIQNLPAAYVSYKSFIALNITATVGSDTYTYTKNGWPFEDGKYYEITVKMNAPASGTDLSTLTDDYYEAQDGETLTGTLTNNVMIYIVDGATVTLKDVNITNLGDDCDWAGINCLGDATLVLEGTNEVCAGRDGDGYNNYPGIYIAPGYTLTIQGDGTLTAYSDAYEPYGAGIGGGFDKACGNIVINSGNITATGGEGAAGIGGREASCGNITINGGTVTATGGQFAAGIGGGIDGDCGTITINGGNITATGGQYAAGIGTGYTDGAAISCGNITISGGTVTATGGTKAAGIGSGNNGGGGASHGTITITSGVTSVTATKGSDAPNSIGAGASGADITVNIEAGANVTQN